MATDLGWARRAGCRDTDTRVFYPEPGPARANKAKAICAACPVRKACLDHAVGVGERWGVWGGLTEEERRALRRSGQVPA